ncbi:MAG TPA: 50S ribosomal protein L18 [Acidobacteriota bacterium]|nr:50S ribosomal protein L18 [Acidobacteriota bacterium]
MSKFKSRNHRRKQKQKRIRNRIAGTAERPRLCIFRSLKHTYVQIVDDEQGRTLASASTLSKDRGADIESAREVGRTIAQKAKKEGIENVVFDRSGYVYRGRVRALADAAREAGLKF